MPSISFIICLNLFDIDTSFFLRVLYFSSFQITYIIKNRNSWNHFYLCVFNLTIMNLITFLRYSIFNILSKVLRWWILVDFSIFGSLLYVNMILLFCYFFYENFFAVLDLGSLKLCSLVTAHVVDQLTVRLSVQIIIRFTINLHIFFISFPYNTWLG